jgi:hypothetical protein
MAQHMWRRFLGYTPLAAAEPGGSEEDGLHKEELYVTRGAKKSGNVALWLTAANVAVLLATLSALFLVRSESRHDRNILNAELRATSSYSKLLVYFWNKNGLTRANLQAQYSTSSISSRRSRQSTALFTPRTTRRLREISQIRMPMTYGMKILS